MQHGSISLQSAVGAIKEAPEATLDPFRTVSIGFFSETGLPTYLILGNPYIGRKK
jgi:hypothetical protein